MPERARGRRRQTSSRQRDAESDPYLRDLAPFGVPEIVAAVAGAGSAISRSRESLAQRSEHVALALREVAELLRCFGRVIDGYRHLLHG